MNTVRILIGDALARLRELPDESVHCVVTSPPYFAHRDYGVDGQLGLEASPAAFVEALADIFDEVRRVLAPRGTCWVNLGDGYAKHGSGGAQGKTGQRADRRFTAASLGPTAREMGLKPKDLIGAPWRVAFELQRRGWWLRSEVIWHKPNPMPESVLDRPTKSHETIFLLAKSAEYHYEADAIREPLAPKTFTTFGKRRQVAGDPNGLVKADRFSATCTERKPRLNADGEPAGANARTVWTIGRKPSDLDHYAMFPPELPERCIRAGCPEGGIVLDPFFGAGTTGIVAAKLGRSCVGIELNPAYAEIAERRIRNECGLLAEVDVIGRATA